MKVVILAGGLGTRFSELTQVIPKPMVEIGGRPVLWHLMNLYSFYGFNEFVLALGYKSEVIKEYFLNFFALNTDFSIDLSSGSKKIHNGKGPNWKIDLIDTGIHSQTGGRLKQLKPWIGNETFMMTYGDGLIDMDIRKLLQFHNQHKRLATVTGVSPPARFGGLLLNGNQVIKFTEKNEAKESWINGGFFVLEPSSLDYIEGNETVWEKEPLELLSAKNQLMAFLHDGFWQPMDTLREYRALQALWESGKAPWKVWDRDERTLEKKESFSDGSDRPGGFLAYSEAR